MYIVFDFYDKNKISYTQIIHTCRCYVHMYIWNNCTAIFFFTNVEGRRWCLQLGVSLFWLSPIGRRGEMTKKRRMEEFRNFSGWKNEPKKSANKRAEILRTFRSFRAINFWPIKKIDRQNAHSHCPPYMATTCICIIRSRQN